MLDLGDLSYETLLCYNGLYICFGAYCLYTYLLCAYFGVYLIYLTLYYFFNSFFGEDGFIVSGFLTYSLGDSSFFAGK